MSFEGVDGEEFQPTPFPNIDPFLFRPVVDGMWTHREAIDGTYSFADLLDAHEMIDGKELNAAEFRAWKKSTQTSGGD